MHQIDLQKTSERLGRFYCIKTAKGFKLITSPPDGGSPIQLKMKSLTPCEAYCDRDRIQTYNLLIRSQMLYSIELRSRNEYRTDEQGISNDELFGQQK